MSYGKINIKKNYMGINFVNLGFALDPSWHKRVGEVFMLTEEEYIIKSKKFNSDINMFNIIFFNKETDCKNFCLDLISNYLFKK